MRWDSATRYLILLKINNAAITQTTKEDLFSTLATQLRKHFSYDRLAINLFDAESQSISYFAAADGINPEGISSRKSRPLKKGSITEMVVSTRKPVIIADLKQYSDFSSVKSMIESGLMTTMAFPLVIRDRILGSIHFSFKKPPEFITELQDVLTDVSGQAAIAVDNMLSHHNLKRLNKSLIREKQYLMTNTDDGYQPDSFFFTSPVMVEIMNLIKKVANSDISILITGETGTGKDYLARYIHNLSPRSNHLFVKTNCPALASSLFESELFGHAKGAFTGADYHRVGRFEMAHGGTVFLDEVGDLPLALQAKLLNVLQDRRFERVGDSKSIEVNFRLIAATNQDLKAFAKSGQFRQDLYYRLNTINIEVPPLRERVEDIPILIEKLTELQARKTNRPAPVYEDRTLDILSEYHWPGNVRELKNLVIRMVILRPGEKITEREIHNIIDITPPAESKSKISSLAESERNHIVQSLTVCQGKVSGENGISSLLKMPRTTLQYRMKKLGINPKDYI